MTFFDKAASQLGGAWGMAFDLEGWRDRLDRSADGVFESFKAFLIAAPLTALLAATARRAASRMPDASESIYTIAPLAPLVIGDIFFLAVEWGVSLALLVTLSRSLGAGRDAAGLIAGYNWSQPIITAIQLPPVAVAAATAGDGLASLLAFPSLALAIAIIWGVVRRGLSVAAGPATAIVAMLIVVSAVLRVFAEAAFRALFAA